MKLAAIDIGSNAVRLLFNNVYQTPDGPVFHKDSIIRAPVRLGEDAFLDGKLSDAKIEDLVRAMEAFKLLMQIHKTADYKACATSAMRVASNGEEVAGIVRDRTGVNIEIISGDAEASIILSRDFRNQLDINAKNYIYIDVGGGSTELVYFCDGRIRASRSFEIGTLRLLNSLVEDSTWDEMKAWVKEHKVSNARVVAIGSGGNINKLMKMYGKPSRTYLSYVSLKVIYEYLKNLTIRERIRDLGMKPDRADVIIPATKIFLKVLKWSGATRVIVPKFGLSDGMIRQLYKKQLVEEESE